MPKIKILFILPKAQQGGAETQMLYILRNINKKFFEVYLGLLYPHNQLKKEFESIPGITTINFEKKGRFDLLVYFRIAKFVRQNKIRIIQTFLGNHHSYIPALMSRNTIAIGGIRGTQDKQFSFFTRAAEFTIPKQLARLNKMDMISNSNAARELYVSKGFPQNNIYVIPNGIDADYYAGGNPKKIIEEFSLQNKTVIGIIARLVEGKNHELIIHCFNNLLSKNKNVKLLIVGDGPEKPKLEKIIKQLNLQESAVITGNRKDIRDILSALDIFLFPSKSEGWPNVVGEAMAAGVPVISYPAGDTEKIITNKVNGIISEPNYHSFKNNLEMLLENKKIREEYGKNAAVYAKKNFTIQGMIKTYENVYINSLRS